MYYHNRRLESEIKESFSFYKAVLLVGARQVGRYLSSYILTYLERDVRIAGHVEDIEKFSRFLALCAASGPFAQPMAMRQDMVP